MRNDNSRRRGKRPGAVPLQCNSRRLVTNWTQLWNRTHVEVEGPRVPTHPPPPRAAFDDKKAVLALSSAKRRLRASIRLCTFTWYALARSAAASASRRTSEALV